MGEGSGGTISSNWDPGIWNKDCSDILFSCSGSFDIYLELLVPIYQRYLMRGNLTCENVGKNIS